MRSDKGQVIELIDGPYQQIAPLTSRMAARNRTRRAEGTRLETRNLIEVDTYATNAKQKVEVKEDEDKLILKMMQTGSSWSKAVTQKTGTCEDNICDLCEEAKETSGHIWCCSRLDEKRRDLDAEIAEADPEEFTPAMRHGVACAMNADPRRSYWGAE